MIELTSAIKKRLCKDFRLPISVFSEPYFEYFVELYDPVFAIKDKINLLESVLSKCKTQEDFFQISLDVANNVKDLISKQSSYQYFNNLDMNEIYPLKKNVSQQNIYIVPNIGKEMISIDLEKANFNCFKLVGLHDELGIYNYKDLISKFTNEEYFIQSKMIRQIIFGDLNPSRQQRLQKYIIQNLCETLLENGCEISSASSDEIIIKNKNSISEVKDILKSVDNKFKFFRVEKFKFDRVGDDFDYFVKKTINEDGNEKMEFKSVPGHFFPQVYKKYFNMPINEYDLLFYHEGYLAQFKEPIFKAENKPSLKI